LLLKKGKSLRFDPANPAGSSLQWLENGKGYWVEIASENAALQDMELMPVLPAASRAQGLFSLNKELNYHIRQFSATIFLHTNKQSAKGYFTVNDFRPKRAYAQRATTATAAERGGLVPPYIRRPALPRIWSYPCFLISSTLTAEYT
jgi:hypothetical protein